MLTVKEKREEEGISVPELGRRSGVSRRTIQDLEKRGDCMVSTLVKLADALGCTLNDLWTDKEKGQA